MPELEKNYNIASEEEIYNKWEESGFFNPDNCVTAGIVDPKKPVFSVLMPPPNVTGILHLGHAMENSLMDIEARFHRMKGEKTLFLPGVDHAAVATQAKVEAELMKQGIKNPRAELGREGLLAKIREYADQAKATIITQIKNIGSSCDWSRLAYTFDEKRSKIVFELFKKMFADGLIYRGSRMINWDPKLQTTISDDEIVWEEETVPFYYLQYGPFVIATARPETKFGDKYVVMHPDDERYQKYNDGDQFECEWLNGKITATVIKDESIDREFGTGVMTITPYHDLTDFEIAKRHDLIGEQIIDFQGKLLPIAGEFAGMDILEARPKIAEKLKAKGLLVKVEENYVHRVAHGDRSKGMIEPQVKEQWFVDVNKKIPAKNKSLKELMREAVTVGLNNKENKKVNIIPERFTEAYLKWIDNLRDWCISRQIWWGHRIPIWYYSGPEKNSLSKMGFHETIVPELLEKGKSRTYRLRDHGFKVGDLVAFENSGSQTLFGTAKITAIKQLTVSQIELPDFIHSGKYQTTSELIEAFKKMHPEKEVTEETPAWIYDYEFKPSENNSERKIWSPQTITELQIMRHGITDWNKEKRVQGDTEVPLDEDNIGEIEALIPKLKSEQFDLIISSTQMRAQQTAEIIREKLELPLETNNLLVERDYGDFEGEKVDEINKEYPDYQKNKITFDIPGEEETYEQVKIRVEKFLEYINKNHSNQKILVITHNAVTRAFHMVTKEVGDEEASNYKLNHGEIEKYLILDGQYKLKDWTQDSDTLDTWFSSGAWTFSTLQGEDRKIYHPTTWMQMGYEILFFWLARMILMTAYYLDEIPFKSVYIHGILRDKDGKKFSKSLGNGIDPIEMSKKYGADALRLALLANVSPGNDACFYEEKVEHYRNFINKLWNISRFILGKDGELKMIAKQPKPKTEADKWLLSRLSETTNIVTEALENYKFSLAIDTLYDFTWSDFADWYLEIAKVEGEKEEILHYVLPTVLKLWQPFAPFVTQTIWEQAGQKDLLMVSPWPIIKDVKDKEATEFIVSLQQVITALRTYRADNKISMTEIFGCYFRPKNFVKEFNNYLPVIERLARVKFVDEEIINGSALVVEGVVLVVEQQVKKVSPTEIADLKKYITSLETKLNDESFMSKAPDAVKEKERAKLATAQEKLATLEK